MHHSVRMPYKECAQEFSSNRSNLGIEIPIAYGTEDKDEFSDMKTETRDLILFVKCSIENRKIAVGQSNILSNALFFCSGKKLVFGFEYESTESEML